MQVGARPRPRHAPLGACQAAFRACPVRPGVASGEALLAWSCGGAPACASNAFPEKMQPPVAWSSRGRPLQHSPMHFTYSTPVGVVASPPCCRSACNLVARSSSRPAGGGRADRARGRAVCGGAPHASRSVGGACLACASQEPAPASSCRRRAAAALRSPSHAHRGSGCRCRARSSISRGLGSPAAPAAPGWPPYSLQGAGSKRSAGSALHSEGTARPGGGGCDLAGRARAEGGERGVGEGPILSHQVQGTSTSAARHGVQGCRKVQLLCQETRAAARSRLAAADCGIDAGAPACGGRARPLAPLLPAGSWLPVASAVQRPHPAPRLNLCKVQQAALGVRGSSARAHPHPGVGLALPGPRPPRPSSVSRGDASRSRRRLRGWPADLAGRVAGLASGRYRSEARP